MAYEVCDISTYQTVSNYTSFANAVDGVILRAGYRGYGSAGNMVKDTKLETHYSGLAGKTKIGYYFFTQATTEAEAEAEATYVVNTLIASKQNDFPIYWDTEGSGAPNGSGRADGLSKAQRTKCCIAFINKIKALGKRAGVYASESWYKTNLDFAQILATGASIWVAKYSSYTPSTSKYDGWQYTSTASVSGISGNVDKSHFYVDVANWDSEPSGGGDDDEPSGEIYAGEKIILTNVPLYASSTATTSAGNRTGTYYIWSADTVNNRVRITNSPSNVGVSGQVTGWINVSDVNGDNPDSDDDSVAVTGVEISSSAETVTLTNGSKTLQLSATVKPSNADNKGVTWSSSDNSVATVNSSGLVTCLKAGTATITVTTNESLYTDTCTVTVKQAVTGVSLNKTTAGLSVSDTLQLTATVVPSDASNKNVTWSSSDSNIATVNSSGLVTAKANGTCTITVTTEDQSKTATCTITVSTHISSVSLDKTSANIEIGKTLQLNATIYPTNTTDDKTLTWSSSDNSVATVNSSGLVTCLKAGTATITVKTSNNLTATCNIKGIIYPTGITLNTTEAEYIINESEDLTLSVTFEPSNTTEKDITWETTNNEIATVNNSGKITCLNPGSCYITATDVKNHKQECLLKVYGRFPKPDAPEILEDNIGKFEITLTPMDGCEYSIDNGKTWQPNSRFTNLNYNTYYTFCQRRYKHEYYLESEKSESINIKTKDIVHIESITLDKHETEVIIEGNDWGTITLNATILPTNADIKDIIWSSDNPAVGDVNDKGVVTLFDFGNVNITAHTVEGGFEDVCLIKVYKKWETPDEPIVVEVTNNSIILVRGEYYEYAKNSLNNFSSNNIFIDLKPNTIYNFWQKKIAAENRLESDISRRTSVKTLSNPIPTPSTIVPISKIKLSANYFYFDIEKNTKATLKYIVSPEDCTYPSVYWYSTDDNVCTVDADGIVNAVGVGTCRLYVRSISDNVIQDSCICEVYKYMNQPDIPQVKDIQLHSIELIPMDGCEYSIDDGETWQDSPLFSGLLKNSYYAFCQRYKEVNSYQPASDKSNSRIVKTLSDTDEGGESHSGYKLGQLVEVNDIDLYCSPYARKASFKVNGDYYIYNINEKNNRIRITDNKDDVGFSGNCTGWVKISELQKVADTIYIGDKIIVNGNINTNVDGSGLFISKQKETMFVTNIFKDFEYSYEVSSKAGANKIGYAKKDDIRKYEE